MISNTRMDSRKLGLGGGYEIIIELAVVVDDGKVVETGGRDRVAEDEGIAVYS